jgi:hypothetical protein
LSSCREEKKGRRRAGEVILYRNGRGWPGFIIFRGLLCLPLIKYPCLI